jgi:hypothetical protein
LGSGWKCLIWLRLRAQVERDVELVGVTAIEDKLQDGVPAAIQTLLDAGMRVRASSHMHACLGLVLLKMCLHVCALL